MSRFPDAMGVLTCAFLPLLLVLAPTAFAENEARPTGYYGYGEVASPEQIAGWDIDVRPDGVGLPDGSGSVEDGEFLYESKCAQCHGSFGEGVGRYPVLAGGEGTLQDLRPQKTVGSYWKYASTLWDYIHRAMPFTQPESLEDDEVYAITAYVLYLNDLVEDDFVLTRENLPDIRMPNEVNFTAEQRPDVKNERCMTDCKDPDSIEITSQGPALAVVATTQESEAEAPSSTGADIYTQYCALCHEGGLGGAPVVGQSAAWAKRVARGKDVLYKHAIEGFEGEEGVMPAKGGFAQLQDDQVRKAVNHMVEQSQ